MRICGLRTVVMVVVLARGGAVYVIFCGMNSKSLEERGMCGVG